MNWNTPVRFVPMIGPIYAKRLEKLEIATAGDLLTHIPARYEDYSLISKIGSLQAGETVTIIVSLISVKNTYTKRGFVLQRAQVADETGQLEVTWFNQPFLVKTLRSIHRVALVGKVEMSGFKLTLVSPEYEVVRENKPLVHTGRIVPVYPETAGISSKWLRSRIAPLLETSIISEYLPPSIPMRLGFMDLPSALLQIHFPHAHSMITRARERLSFDELFLKQIQGEIRRNQWQQKAHVQPLYIDQEKCCQFINRLPFALTGAQKRVVGHILTNLQKSAPMNRLLQGDVGSGKTVVAAIAAFMVYLNGGTTLFMAPTEILAEQHFQTLAKLLTPFGIKVGIQTGSKKNTESRIMNTESRKKSKPHNSVFSIQHSAFDVLVGTHALLEKKVQLDNVKLVVIDEQHRFGVKQRALLREKGATPHVLTMTATPIPRTVALTLYGDLDLSVIDEMPTGRIPVKTWVVPEHKRASAYHWVTSQIKSGKTNNLPQQAFIVCPFIAPSESLTAVKAATAEFEKLQKSSFPDLKLGLLHGKMKPRDKTATLESFRKLRFDVLVCTPVVEVGIDIPTATIIVIEAAERFGLAQLHQLRGRVGRDNKQSYCLLFTSVDRADITRLKHVERAKTGAELAEIDFKIRGPGQVYGLAQHGRDLLRIASFTDEKLIQLAQTEAKHIIRTDPTLQAYPLLKERVRSGKIGEVVPD